MSIKPIDLQTVFAKMNEVGKEQSHLKGAVESQQAREAQKMIDREVKQDHAVNTADEDRETKATDEDGKNGTAEDNKKKEYESRDKEPENEAKKSVVTDPDIGKHIDISG